MSRPSGLLVKNTETTKFCPNCETVKPRSEFYKASRRGDGLQGLCKPCTNATKRASMAKNLDYYREMYKRHGSSRRQRNPDAVKAEHRREYERHRDRYNVSRAAWFATHPGERERLHRLSRIRRRTREYQAFVENVDPIVLWARDEGICYLCGETVSFYLMHVDHVVPISKGGEHSYANTRATHADCNQWKATRLPSQVIGSAPPTKAAS